MVKELEDAYAESENTKQKIVAVFGADWCGACKKLHKDLMDNPKVIDNCIYVYIDIDIRKDLKKNYAVGKVPDIMVLDKNVEVKRRVGYKNLEEFKNGYQTKVDNATCRCIMGATTIGVDYA